MITSGGNLIGAVHCGLTPWSSDQAGDVIGKDPLLDPLADNGGTSCTHALRSGSPAINTGWPRTPQSGAFACEAYDQRWVTRDSRCDIGSFEAYKVSPAGLGCTAP